MSAKVWLWQSEAHTGPFSLDQVMRMSKAKTATRETLYFCEKADEWRPLWRMPEEWGDSFAQTLARFTELGIERAEYLLAGDRRDCKACRALSRQRIAVADPPPIPPVDCACNPWPRTCLIAAK